MGQERIGGNFHFIYPFLFTKACGPLTMYLAHMRPVHEMRCSTSIYPRLINEVKDDLKRRYDVADSGAQSPTLPYIPLTLPAMVVREH